MGSATASSKPKKNSVEDRRKRMNPKSRKRRRISSSSYSSSSDRDDVSHRQESSRRKPEQRRGRDPKRSIKRKRRKPRHRSVSSSSRDSSGSSDRSISPIRHHREDRKRKLKKVKRGRKLDVAVRSSKNRNRSPSCSTSSGRETQNNTPRRIYNCREDTSKERDDSRQIELPSVIESQEEMVERYVGEGRQIDNEINTANYDDLPRANTGRNVVSFEQDWATNSGSFERAVEVDRWMSERNFLDDSYYDQFEDSGRQTSEFYNQLEDYSNVSGRIKSEIVAACKHDPESDDLELMLRKKALENLKKLRSVPAADESSEIPHESAKKTSENPHESAKKIISLSESDSVISKHAQSQVGVFSDESNMNTVNKLTSMELNYSTSQKEMTFSHLNESRVSKQLESSMRSQNTSSHPNIIGNSSEKISYRQSPHKSSLEKDAIVKFGSGNSLKAEVSLGEELASGNTCPNEKEKAQETNENVKECQSGSQFEKKTFSRIHDGEMVQVSYKVYIPNKAPALARRKLQR